MNYNFSSILEYYNNCLDEILNTEWIGGIGVGFKKDIMIAKKLYINFEKDIPISLFPFEELKPLYKEFLSYKNSKKCANNSIAVKKYLDKKLYSEYFHIKLKKDFVFNKNDKLFNINLDSLDKGVSVEKILDKIEVKRYYYIYDKLSIAAILKYYNILEDYNNIKYIEYTGNPKKIILIFKEGYNVSESIKKNLCEEAYKICEEVLINYKLNPVFYGKYLFDNISGVYWDLYKKDLSLIDLLNKVYE